MHKNNNKSSKLTCGYVAFGTQFYEPKNLIDISERAEKQLTAAGLELLHAGVVYGETDLPTKAIDYLKTQEFDYLFVNIINWIDTRGVFRVLHEFRNVPMILYSFGGFTAKEGEFGYKAGTLISPAAGAGSTSLRYTMEQWGIKFKYLFNGPDQAMDISGILSFSKAANVAKRLKYARLGMFGFNDMGLYSTSYNPTRMRDQLGIEVESVDLLQLKNKMASISDADVKAETARVSKDWEYPAGNPQHETIEKAVRMYMATVQICEEKGFDAVSYKCVEGVDQEMGLVHAIPASLVNSAGYPYIDENDLGNLAAELMLKWLTNQQTMFIEHYEHHPDYIILGEDGYCPFDFVEGKVQIKKISTVLLEGIVQCSNMKKGRYTMACLQENYDGYQIQIVEGEGKERPQWVEMGVPLPSWPSITFVPDISVREVLDKVQSQHYACVMGNHADSLKDLCKLLNIKVL